MLPEYQRAPQVTRERLYLETLEQIYASSTKVLVDTKGNGNMIYLPLDKLVEQRRAELSAATANSSAAAAGSVSRTISAASDTVAQDARTRGTR